MPGPGSALERNDHRAIKRLTDQIDRLNDNLEKLNENLSDSGQALGACRGIGFGSEQEGPPDSESD